MTDIDDKIVTLDRKRAARPRIDLDDVLLDVRVRYWHYGRLCRAAAIFNTTIADVLERILDKEFGRGKGAPTHVAPEETVSIQIPENTQQAIERAIERWL